MLGNAPRDKKIRQLMYHSPGRYASINCDILAPSAREREENLLVHGFSVLTCWLPLLTAAYICLLRLPRLVLLTWIAL